MKLPPKAKPKTEPKYDLESYRTFIREAAPYVSLIIGKKLKPQDADRLSLKELTRLALIIDDRVKDLKPPTL